MLAQEWGGSMHCGGAGAGRVTGSVAIVVPGTEPGGVLALVQSHNHLESPGRGSSQCRSRFSYPS